MLGARASQDWYFFPHTLPGGDTYYNIQNAGTRLWLTIAEGPGDNRAVVSGTGTDFVRLDAPRNLATYENQKWRVIQGTDGSYNIQSYRSGLSIGLPDTSLTPLVAVNQKPWIFSNQATMRFQLEAVPDTTPPEITLSVASKTVVLATAGAAGTPVDLSGIASAVDIIDPAPVITNNAPALFPVGMTVVTFTARDASGNTSQAQLTVKVVYNFSYLPPLSAGTDENGNRTIPVKFVLTAADGTKVANATAALLLFLMNPAPIPVEPQASGNSNTGNLFRFEDGQYIYNLSTRGLNPGIYMIRAQLNDTTVHDAVIVLR